MSGARGRKRGSSSTRYVGELFLTPEPGPLLQNTEVEKYCFLLLGYFAGVRLVGRRRLALEGLLGDRRGEQCWSGCLGDV